MNAGQVFEFCRLIMLAVGRLWGQVSKSSGWLKNDDDDNNIISTDEGHLLIQDFVIHLLICLLAVLHSLVILAKF